jgi:branched-chain amino acid transport system ATP-binding protein
MSKIMSTIDVTKRFRNLVAVDHVTLDVENEGILSIIGPNGAGKTTFFNLLTGLVKPDGGKIYFKGEDITILPPYEIVKRRISRSFQVVSLFDDMSIYDNVRIGCQSFLRYKSKLFSCFEETKTVNEAALKIIERVGLIGMKDNMVKTISHGHRKILDIAVSLTTEPEVLLLDEPTSGLAGEDLTKMIDLITEDLSKKMKVVIVEHNMDIVFNFSDQILVLNQGKVLALGTPCAISENVEVQKAYLGGDRGYAGA